MSLSYVSSSLSAGAAPNSPRNTPFGAELARIQGRVERLYSHAADVSNRLALP